MKHFTALSLLTVSLLLTACGGSNEATPPIKPTPAESTAAINNINAEQNMEEDEFKGSFSDALQAFSGDSICNMSTEDDEFSATAVMWIEASSQRMYQESEITTEGTTQNMKMIVDNNMRYMWGDALPNGVKMGDIKFDESLFDDFQLDEEDEANEEEDINLEFECEPWNVDEAKFVVPTNVEFVDMTDSMNQMIEVSENLINGQAPGEFKMDCSICDLAPSAEQAECRAALNC